MSTRKMLVLAIICLFLACFSASSVLSEGPRLFIKSGTEESPSKKALEISGVDLENTPRKLLEVALNEPIKPPEIEPKETTDRHSEIECEWLTKICVSEGGFNFEECEKILQTLENMRGKKTLLSIMYSQASHVTRQKPFTDVRQVWISYLPMEGTDPPKGWIECDRKQQSSRKCTGTWAATSKEWVAFRAKIHDLYYSGVVPDLIPGFPIQWGGEMDYWRGVHRNFCPLNVGGLMRNTYWGDPRDPRNSGKCLPIDDEKIKKSKVLSADIASGRRSHKAVISELLKKN